MMTTISAFMVKTTPDRGAEGQEHADQHAAGGDQRAAEREGERRDRGDVDRDQLRGDRIDRDGADRGAVPGARQREIERQRRSRARRRSAISRFSASVAPSTCDRHGEVAHSCRYAPPNITSMMPWTMNSRPKVARMLSTSSTSRVLARRTSGVSRTR